MAAWALARASARHPQRASGPQAGDELALERAAALHVERLIDRLVRDPHPRIIGELELGPLSDLLRLHPLTHRRSWRCGFLRPFHGARAGPLTGVPPGATSSPASRCCTYSRNRGLLANLAGF